MLLSMSFLQYTLLLFVRSSIHSFTHFINSVIPSFAHSVTRLFVQSFIWSVGRSCIHSFIHPSIHSVIPLIRLVSHSFSQLLNHSFCVLWTDAQHRVSRISCSFAVQQKGKRDEQQCERGCRPGTADTTAIGRHQHGHAMCLVTVLAPTAVHDHSVNGCCHSQDCFLTLLQDSTFDQ